MIKGLKKDRYTPTSQTYHIKLIFVDCEAHNLASSASQIEQAEQAVTHQRERPHMNSNTF